MGRVRSMPRKRSAAVHGVGPSADAMLAIALSRSATARYRVTTLQSGKGMREWGFRWELPCLTVRLEARELVYNGPYLKTSKRTKKSALRTLGLGKPLNVPSSAIATPGDQAGGKQYSRYSRY